MAARFLWSIFWFNLSNTHTLLHMKSSSRLGLILAAIYVVICALLIWSQGLFGESFIALILGLPWSMVFALFEFGGASGALIYVMVLAPLALNTFLLYCLGVLIGRNR